MSVPKLVKAAACVIALITFCGAASARYVESDPVGLEGGLNTYGYVNANPVNLSDPKGLAAEGAAVGGAIGAGVGGVAGAVVGGGGGTLVAPGVGTVGGGVAGAAQGATWGALGGAAAGSLIQDAYNWCTVDDTDDSDRCKQVRTQCAASCSDVLPDTDLQSMNFQKCYSQCLEDNGCLGMV